MNSDIFKNQLLLCLTDTCKTYLSILHYNMQHENDTLFYLNSQSSLNKSRAISCTNIGNSQNRFRWEEEKDVSIHTDQETPSGT